MATTKKMACKCGHAGQDLLHGKGVRLHNRCKPKEQTPTWRCTVCGSEKHD